MYPEIAVRDKTPTARERSVEALNNRHAPDMLEDRGGRGAGARELPAGPGLDGQVHVNQHHRPRFHRRRLRLTPIPRTPGHDPQQRALHLHAPVGHERPEHAHDAPAAAAGPRRRPPLGPRRGGGGGALVGERREGHAPAGGECAPGERRDGSGPGRVHGQDGAEVAAELAARGRGVHCERARVSARPPPWGERGREGAGLAAAAVIAGFDGREWPEFERRSGGGGGGEEERKGRRGRERWRRKECVTTGAR